MNRIYRAAHVLGIHWPQASRHTNAVTSTIITALTLALLPVLPAQAAGALTSARVSLSDPRPSTTSVTYTFTGSSVDGATAVQCVKVIWATSLSGDTAPVGFSGATGSVNAASSTLINSSSTNWSLAKSDGTSSSGQNNIYEYTHSAGGVTPSTTTGATFVLAGITNSSLADNAYYFRINTYGNTNCSSSPIDNAYIQYINTNGSQLSVDIDPTLTFTVNPVSSGTSCDGTTTTATSTSTTIPFGAVTAAANAVVCQDLQVTTNSTNGFSVYLRYTGAPSNGFTPIADHTGSNTTPSTFSAAGTEAYGYTTNDATLGVGTADRFTNPSQGWAAATTNNAEVGYSATGVNTTTFRIGHQAGVSTTTDPGTYSTTIIYTCTPVY